MKKILRKYKMWILITNIIIFIPLIVGIIVWDRLPDTLPMHFDFRGRVDSYSGKMFGLLFGPLFSFIIYWFFLFLIVLDSKKNKKSIIENTIIMKVIMSIMPLLSLYIGYLVYGVALELSLNPNMISLIFLGIVYIVIGGCLHDSEPNGVFGVRFPWTVSDADNWIKTNRLTGILMSSLGIVFLIDVFFQLYNGLGTCLLVFGGSILVLIISSIYSFVNRKR